MEVEILWQKGKDQKFIFFGSEGKVLALATDPWIQKGLNSKAARFSMAEAVNHLHFGPLLP